MCVLGCESLGHVAVRVGTAVSAFCHSDGGLQDL
jgi:hypothetical protein